MDLNGVLKRGKTGSQNSDNLNDNSEDGGKSYHLRTDEQLAKLAGTSRDTIRKVSRASGVGASVFPPLGGKAFVRRVLGDERSRHLSAIGGGGTRRSPRP